MDELYSPIAARAKRLYLLCLAADAGALLNGGQRYRGPAAGTTRTVVLDRLIALYDRRSGATHLVAAPVPEILAALRNGDATLSSLMTALAAENEREALIERLDELVAAGLAERL